MSGRKTKLDEVRGTEAEQDKMRDADEEQDEEGGTEAELDDVRDT